MNRTYWSSFLVSLDRFLAALLFGEADFTISALCAAARLHPLKGGEKFGVRFQRAVLNGIGWALDKTMPGHVARARNNALSAASEVRRVLGALTP